MWGERWWDTWDSSSVWNVWTTFIHISMFLFPSQLVWRRNCWVILTFCRSSGSISSARRCRASSGGESLRWGKRSCNLPPPAAPGCWRRTWWSTHTHTHRSNVLLLGFHLSFLPLSLTITSPSHHFLFHLLRLKTSSARCCADRSGWFLQEEVLHDVGVVLTAAVREMAGCKHDDGIQALSIIT